MAEHTHMYICHYVQWRSADAGGAAEGERGGGAAAGERSGGQSSGGRASEAEDSGWDEELPRARPPPPPCPRGWPTMLGEAPPAGEGEEAEEAIVSWLSAASPSLLNSLATALARRRSTAALALRYSVRGLLALHCSAHRRARAFRCSVAALALRCAACIRARHSACCLRSAAALRCLRSATGRPRRIASPTATTTVESRRRRRPRRAAAPPAA
uniref:Uncharacterized protein n=1 Tax=Oryza sativa subsp. japonica TaxID=39947 RepID=Q6K7Q2_ORYSJ|nr:hypothetical protein [Oryza sativa Japonica Group]